VVLIGAGGHLATDSDGNIVADTDGYFVYA